MKRIKAIRRRYFKQKIKTQALDLTHSAHLCALLSQWLKPKPHFITAVYHALAGELSPAEFVKKGPGRFVFPHLPKRSSKTPALKNKMSFIFEDGRPCCISDIDLFLVPGLAFDRMGRRLGRGGGHYDRALAKARGLKVGLAGSYQIWSEDLPEEAHDIRMDAVSTERFALFPVKHSAFFSHLSKGVC